jgi:phospholipid/cholesterol/gamma-HCH transport system substrate-binding protein
LIGTKALRIDLGNSPTALADEDTLTAELEYSFAQQVGQQVGPIKDKTERLIESIDSLSVIMRELLDSKTQGHIKGSLAHLESSMAALDHMVSADNSHLNRSLKNISSVTGTLSANQEKISKTLVNIADLSDSLTKADIGSTLRNTGSVIHRLDSTLSGLQQGQGTLGKLLKNDSLYQNLNQSSQSLDSLLIDLKVHPGRYVQFSLFGRKH